MASERLQSRPACLLVASGAAEVLPALLHVGWRRLQPAGGHPWGESSQTHGRAPTFLGGRTIDFVDVNDSNARWVQDFRLKAYASPAKLESIDGARYHALLIPSCPGALADLASSGSLARILQHFRSESKPICAVGHGVAALCCATNEDRSWVFQGYSVTGPSVYELVRAPGFARLPLIVEDFVKDAGASFSASEPDAVHVVLDRHLVTGQNASSTVPAVQNLLFLCGSRK
ncbi:glutamine amidotransferase-like class 1 domain-containing protein 1 isoform X1 [Panthera tigris]|uniref:glutamine amidotransferase-like class 1 domain-containing protein 1 isoform X1 n=2 Tax=Panthera tigris TaxID=9694 RepID=UPI001C6F737C|nr:glutamine amidotransferase-like class 1 domain-containing protein 1 isoform X1 [Panthera tigris]XP_049508641.1 glutamine amidotransferase-like class 1 domain-containing protein 1 isoform X1 [Panthera uncia]